MAISRRQFLTSTATTVGSAALLSKFISVKPVNLAEAETEKTSYRGVVAVLQGFTNQDSTQITVLFDKRAPVAYRVFDPTGREMKIDFKRREIKAYSNYALDKFAIDNLFLGTSYRLQIIDEDSGKTVDERRFSALDVARTNTRFVVATCMKDTCAVPREVMWDRVAEVKPDFVLLVGDTCYADQHNDGDEAGFWRRYAETRSKLSHFRQKNLIPTLAVWDDHDFGTNNGNSTFISKNMVREIFQSFWDSEKRQGLEMGPGQSLVFSGFGQRFFLMDGRYFRTPPTEVGKIWGAEQEEFFFENLNKSSDPAWIMNGTLFFGGYLKWESFEYHQNKNFQELLKQIAQAEAPVNFVSGDVHFSEIMKIEPKILGYETVEYVSSSIHSSYFPGMEFRHRNPRRVDTCCTHNFMVFETSSSKATGDWNVQMDCVNSKLSRLMTHKKNIRR